MPNVVLGPDDQSNLHVYHDQECFFMMTALFLNCFVWKPIRLVCLGNGTKQTPGFPRSILQPKQAQRIAEMTDGELKFY